MAGFFLGLMGKDRLISLPATRPSPGATSERVWARDARIGRNECKRTATETIKRLEAEEEARVLSVAERMERQRAKVAVAAELKMEETEWR
ncbi:hypothetical protein QJS10_CPB04g01320 [Acorus calamus]|uniref:Uncharacterized protein n=1 Tax=Acorus calamus TaxID=4465 RepID=A0AAV9F2S2_ACOCL|nr:hypothetical protein QJS10_CPB04g01320 [Acorus calamus]